MSESQPSLCGCIAIVGRPNVGKSTLLNHLIRQKVSITSRKPQTTRFNVTGVKTEGRTQMVFVDTPGMHKKDSKAINRFMNRAANSALSGVDLIIFVVDRAVWTDEDEMVMQRINARGADTLIVVNKMDRIEDKAVLPAHLLRMQASLNPAAIIPISALKNQNLDVLENEIIKRLPPGEHLFPEDQVTDKSARFLAAELIREKIMRQLGAELPYQVAVEIEEFREEGKVVHISGLILVEREGQKRILIGEKGGRLKSIGQSARQDIEVMLDTRVMLRLWVKVRSGWSDDERALKSLGYVDE